MKSFSKLLGREAKGSEGWSQVASSGSCSELWILDHRAGVGGITVGECNCSASELDK